jgi:hypothetical protein
MVYVVLAAWPGLTSTSVAQTPAKEEVPLTSQMIRTGQRLISSSIELVSRGMFRGLIRVNVQIKKPVLVDLSTSKASSPDLDQVQEQIARVGKLIQEQTNPVLKEQLQAAKQALELSKRQIELAEEQHSFLVEKFIFDTESVLRKSKYEFPDDQLVVVVADFSSGNPEEGREIADEIAQNLEEMAKATNLPFHVLVGEVKPGMVVRSQQMARDVGKSLPPNSEYVVIWGTMSPHTIGKYRPHLTCCMKHGEQDGVSVNVDLAIEASDLPLEGEPQARAREAYRRLIGVTCAAVPSAVAAHAINSERTPDLSQYYEFLGKDSPEATALKTELEPLTRWTRTKSEWSRRQQSAGVDRPPQVRRTAAISVPNPYPKTVYSEKDGSLLALISEPDGGAKVFTRKDTGEKQIVYMDVLEVSNDQFLAFLNSDEPLGGQGNNKTVGGVPWINLDPEFSDIEQSSDGPFVMHRESYRNCPVVGVSWFAARDYCKWAGKELPSQEEWEAAAVRTRDSQYPWGNSKKPDELSKWSYTMPCGLNVADRSEIGCFDMKGNVQEWCADLASGDSERVVRGAGYRESEPEDFDIKQTRRFAQVSYSPYVGFRGVIRMPAE